MIGTKIRNLRKERKMTLRELADALGVPFTTLGNYERGDRKPDLQFLLDISKYFGVSMDFLTRTDEIPSYEDYKVVSYIEDTNEMLNKANPEIRKKILEIYDQLFLITCEHAITPPNNNELEILESLFNSIIKMKQGFGIGLKKDGFSPSTKFELAKSYIEEKEKIDKYLNQLFKIYIERSVK
ncbi:helix-turn-helix domain-containing protein [Priestia megaterium]|uniref:helix-turn-helix domain-containing protein n=1 Tax=Priestia megaterium TaxID=1404 RepID=UPI0028563D27|nr:helix-turn-helix transcriptional regulator [Priestia megaterium]MDR7207953.1 transcriptional regulator with XRE-family HTH domain [Priestia megaterium]